MRGVYRVFSGQMGRMGIPDSGNGTCVGVMDGVSYVSGDGPESHY